MSKKDHASRNQELSNTLLDGKKFYDWTIVTAFYSAIHYVEGSILPCEIATSTCSNINDVKKAYKMAGRHASRERLVFDKMSLVNAVKYKWLDDRSRYSRYTTYKVTVTEATKAQEYLKAIAEECYPDVKPQPLSTAAD